jgi:hypothetical protein
MNYGKSAMARRKKFGPANQMAFERDEKIERDAKRSRLTDQRAASKKHAAKEKRRAEGETGMSAGTMGGSRGAMMKFFTGRR